MSIKSIAKHASRMFEIPQNFFERLDDKQKFPDGFPAVGHIVAIRGNDDLAFHVLGIVKEINWAEQQFSFVTINQYMEEFFLADSRACDRVVKIVPSKRFIDRESLFDICASYEVPILLTNTNNDFLLKAFNSTVQPLRESNPRWIANTDELFSFFKNYADRILAIRW